jgi:hypothetical protein
MFGFHPGQCYAETAGNGFVEMASELLREAAVTPAIDVVEASPDTIVEWRIGTSLGRRVLFLLNYEPQAQRVKVSLPAAGGRANDLFSAARLEPQNDHLLVHLPPREIACIQW